MFTKNSFNHQSIKMKKLESLFKKLENKIEYSTVLNPKVSKGSVGWHIEHILLTTSLIIRAIEKSNPLDYKSKFNFVKMCVFTLNKIPRGKVQAPNSVRPVENFSEADIKNNFKTCCNLIDKLPSLKENNFLCIHFLTLKFKIVREVSSNSYQTSSQHNR
jgi:hypothetical protein